MVSDWMVAAGILYFHSFYLGRFGVGVVISLRMLGIRSGNLLSDRAHLR